MLKTHYKMSTYSSFICGFDVKHKVLYETDFVQAVDDMKSWGKRE